MAGIELARILQEFTLPRHMLSTRIEAWLRLKREPLSPWTIRGLLAENISRQQMRQTLMVMEKQGTIVRVVPNCHPAELERVNCLQAIRKELVIPLRDMPTDKRKALGPSRTLVYLTTGVTEARHAGC